MPIAIANKKGELKMVNSRAELNAFMEYAVNVSQLASEQLLDGVIVVSPYENACLYCQYKGMCRGDEQIPRSVSSVSAETILKANKEKENG